MPVTHQCVVPGCSSTTKDPKHYFPRRPWSAEKWREAINSPLLNSVKTEDLCKYLVCYKHFTESDYSTTQKRRRLNINCVPSVNLENCEEVNENWEEVTEKDVTENFKESADPNTSVVMVADADVTSEVHLEYDEEDCTQLNSEEEN